MDRVERIIMNSKQSKIRSVRARPSTQSMREGEEAIYLEKNKPLTKYRKEKGILWHSYMSRDGNEYVDRNLIVNKDIRGVLKAKKVIFDKGSELTISSGSISVTRSWHTVNTEGGGSSDNLDNISGGEKGMLLILTAADSTNTVTVRNDEGSSTTNILIGSSFSLDDDDDTIVLFHNGNNWTGISALNNE